MSLGTGEDKNDGTGEKAPGVCDERARETTRRDGRSWDVGMDVGTATGGTWLSLESRVSRAWT